VADDPVREDAWDWHRFVVTLEGLGNERWEYPVFTRFGELKAVAVAVNAWAFEHGPRKLPFRVAVVDLGPTNDPGDALGDARED
jgi:hypothetical protein